VAATVRIPRDSPTVDLRVGEKQSGEAVHEEVPVAPLGSRRYRLLTSPTLALGAAAGDEIEVDAKGVYSVVRRGSNVAVHVEATEELDDGELVRQVNELGGVLDGRAEAPPNAFIATFTIPVQAGFAAIERVFERFAADNAAASWSYGNVYDSAGEPLNWWLDVHAAGR
jgi:Domain of unknown function (DUF4265)